MTLDPNRKPMPPEKLERVKAQVRRNCHLIRMGRARKQLQQKQPENRSGGPRSRAQ